MNHTTVMRGTKFSPTALLLLLGLQILLIVLGTTPLVEAEGQNGEPIAPFREVLSHFLFEKKASDDSSNKIANAPPPQDVLIIGANIGRTGTSSMVVALRRLGIKSYHMKEGVMETPGHLQLWYENAISQQQINSDAIIDTMAEEGFNATFDAPVHLLYKDLMVRYPDAKVVLTVRPNPSAKNWAKSVYESVSRMQQALRDIPFRWVPVVQKFTTMADWIWKEYGGSSPLRIDPTTGLPYPEDLERAYDAWVAEVKAHVPPEKLLIFAPGDGWGPLCAFIAPLAASIEAACQEVLESGEPYPFVNESKNFQYIGWGLEAIVVITKALPIIFILLVIISYYRKKQQREKDGKLD